MTISAAVGDYRFSDIALEELPDIGIEISVLTPLKRLEKLEDLETGRHGVYIKSGLKKWYVAASGGQQDELDKRRALRPLFPR
ncbi:MAG: AMMECR1 domain-containing protein [Bacteroidales bacterium]|nr:AMMECR1 domain-containing protein [Bacteroidales bacterium]